MRAGTRRAVAVVSVVLLAAAARAADPAYIGKWKFNQAKSAVSGDTVTIGPAAGGMMEFNSQGFAYTFKLDGKDYPTPDGGTTAWTATSADVWDVTNRMNGKVSADVRGRVHSVGRRQDAHRHRHAREREAGALQAGVRPAIARCAGHNTAWS
jgi:hypothetical protein